jgi:hypothetical protein
MFLEQVKASFIANGIQIANQINQENEGEYLRQIQNWVKGGGKDGEPKPDVAVEAQFNFDGNFELKIVPTDRPVSLVNPKDFLPKYGTDESAVGGEVGGPIPGQPKRFYAAANASPWLGKMVRIGDRRFIFTATTPFNRFWEEV